MIVPVNFASGMISAPAASLAGLMLNIAMDVTAASHTVASAKWRPGHSLVSINVVSTDIRSARVLAPMLTVALGQTPSSSDLDSALDPSSALV